MNALLSAGASTELTDSNGLRARDHAGNSGQTSIARLLQRHGRVAPELVTPDAESRLANERDRAALLREAELAASQAEHMVPLNPWSEPAVIAALVTVCTTALTALLYVVWRFGRSLPRVPHKAKQHAVKATLAQAVLRKYGHATVRSASKKPEGKVINRAEMPGNRKCYFLVVTPHALILRLSKHGVRFPMIAVQVECNDEYRTIMIAHALCFAAAFPFWLTSDVHAVFAKLVVAATGSGVVAGIYCTHWRVALVVL